MDLEVPDDAEVRAITDHNGNVCGYVFGRYELPWPLIDRIKNPPCKRGVTHPDVRYHLRRLNGA